MPGAVRPTTQSGLPAGNPVPIPLQIWSHRNLPDVEARRRTLPVAFERRIRDATRSPIMKVLFAGGNGYPPEFSGGVQSSTHHLAEQLIEHGHEAAVLAALFGDGVFGFKARAKMKLLRQPAVIDSYPGYPVVRAWF